MSSAPFDHRLSRVENDVTALYDMVADIQAVQRQHSADLARIQAKLGDHDARFDAHDARFDAHDARFDTIDARFDAIDSTLAEILRRLPEAS